MNIEKKLDELFILLDNCDEIKRIEFLKGRITDKELNLINIYRNNPCIDNKKKLYDNEIINEYLMCESKINYLIMAINNRFKRSHDCASNKW